MKPAYTGLLAAIIGFLAANDCYAKSQGSSLPPNWNSGGKAKETYQPGNLPPKTKKGYVSEEPDFTPEKQYSKRHLAGAFGALPEIARLEYRYSLSPYLALTLGASGPMPVNIDVSMPSDVIKADPQKGLAVAYPAFDIKFKVDWGPHIYAGASWHPFGGAWYTSFAAGFRSVKIHGEASSPLRICSIIEAAKEPPCGNDSSAIQTRNSIALTADVSLMSYAGRFATGWVIGMGSKWALIAEAGIFTPVKTKEVTSVEANIVAPDGTPADLSGALEEIRSKSEVDLADKASTELGKVTNHPLPVLGIGLGYRF